MLWATVQLTYIYIYSFSVMRHLLSYIETTTTNVQVCLPVHDNVYKTGIPLVAWTQICVIFFHESNFDGEVSLGEVIFDPSFEPIHDNAHVLSARASTN